MTLITARFMGCDVRHLCDRENPEFALCSRPRSAARLMVLSKGRINCPDCLAVMRNDPRWTPRVDQSRVVEVLRGLVAAIDAYVCLLSQRDGVLDVDPYVEIERIKPELEAAREALRKAGVQ